MKYLPFVDRQLSANANGNNSKQHKKAHQCYHYCSSCMIQKGLKKTVSLSDSVDYFIHFQNFQFRFQNLVLEIKGFINCFLKKLFTTKRGKNLIPYDLELRFLFKIWFCRAKELLGFPHFYISHFFTLPSLEVQQNYASSY